MARGSEGASLLSASAVPERANDCQSILFSGIIVRLLQSFAVKISSYFNRRRKKIAQPSPPVGPEMTIRGGMGPPYGNCISISRFLKQDTMEELLVMMKVG